MPANQAISYSIRGAVAASGLSRSRLYELIKQGSIEARKDGRKTLVLGESLWACIYALPPLEGGTGRPKPMEQDKLSEPSTRS